MRARLRGLANTRARREGSSGYAITGGAGFAQLGDARGVAAYVCTRGLVVAWCNGAAEGAGWYSNREAAQMGFDYVRRMVSAGTTADLEHRQRLAGELANPRSSAGVWDVA
jgi:hypothetical protein